MKIAAYILDRSRACPIHCVYASNVGGYVSGPIQVRCWGTRGSIPTPGPHTVRYGGNTSCVEVRVDGRSYVFDAGTGIRPLGNYLSATARPCSVDIFLTHFHWDHVHGFPFFKPLYDDRARVCIHAPDQAGQTIEELFADLMNPHYFPVPFQEITARLELEHTADGVVVDRPGIRVRAFRVRHPSYTVGYRIETAGRTIVYIPDCEIDGPQEPVADSWRKGLIEFCSDADLLIHDAMYTDDEYRSKVGWGHSTYRQVVELAIEAGVCRLQFFHHSPDRTDDELDALLERARTHVRQRGSVLKLTAAAEGEEIDP